MTRDEFITRANHTGQVLTEGVHYNGAACARIGRDRGGRFHFRQHGFWHHCAARGAITMPPTGLPDHGPAICAPGAYAA